MAKYEFDILEEYNLNGEHRYRLKVRGYDVLINVAANNVEEAIAKATAMLDKVRVEKYLRSMKEVKGKPS